MLCLRIRISSFKKKVPEFHGFTSYIHIYRNFFISLLDRQECFA